LCICKNEGLCVVIVSYVDDLFTNKGWYNQAIVPTKEFRRVFWDV
jgi:hypothetical protein